MPLLNYTTESAASKRIAESTRMLQEGGASAIMLENGPDREITAIGFVMETTFGRLPFHLPANVGAVIATINAQIRAEDQIVRTRSRYHRKIPRNLFGNKAQAERIAWRIAKDWLEAQLAISQIGSTKFEQIMMPFATINGKSFYQRLVERGTLLLPAPSTGEPENVTNV